jgi:hypothetical protein
MPGAAVLAPPGGEPESLADTLVASERAIRDPSRDPAGLESAGQAQQNAYRQLVEHPEWLERVLSRVPADLQATVRANFSAGVELRALTRPRPQLPAWRIVAPAPAAELLGYYRAAEEEIGVAWEYLAAIHLVETRMGRIRGTSVAGAQGPMQFLPSTWRRYGRGNINSNRDSILAAARLLKANGAPDDMREALYHYNPTPRYVTAVINYAGQMQQNQRAYFGYYHWQVYFRMPDGDRLLPVGYGA